MGLQIFPVRRSETVEIPINNIASSQFRFTDNESTLDRMKVFGIVIHTESLSKSFSGKTVLANSIQKKAFLTLATEDTAMPVKRLPLETFFNDQKFMIEMDGIPVDVRKSFIELQDKAGVNAGDCFVITFFYDKI